MLWFNVDRFIEIMQITNIDTGALRTEIENIPNETRSLPSLIMFLISSKVLVLLTINFMIIYVYFVAAWKVCRENQQVIFAVTKPQKNYKKENKTVAARQAATSVRRVGSAAATPPEIITIGKTEKSQKLKTETPQPSVIPVQRVESFDETPPKVALIGRMGKTQIAPQPATISVQSITETPPDVTTFHRMGKTQLAPQPATISSIERVESIAETQPKISTIGGMEKTQKAKPKVVEVARIDESEMTEIQLPRIRYQRQPSREIIPLPSPPSFKNRRNEKTKI